MEFRYYAAVLLVLAPACAVATHRAPQYGPSRSGPVVAGASDPKELDDKISAMNAQISGLDLQIATLNQQITGYQSSSVMGKDSLASQARQERDRLQNQRSSLTSQQGSLQVIRNSMQSRKTVPTPAH